MAEVKNMIKLVHNKEEYSSYLNEDSDKLVVVYYFAKWCGPCGKLKIIYDELAKKLTDITFLKLDVDECEDIALENDVSVLPTFLFYKNKEKVGVFMGSDASALEEKIKKLMDKEPKSLDVTGHVDLTSLIAKNETECLNESDTHPLLSILGQEQSLLESDTDAQLIMSVSFTEPVRIHSLIILAGENGPKDVRIFINQPRTLDFDSAESYIALQDMTLTPEQLTGLPILLHYVKYQHVTNFQIFVKNNQLGSDRTSLFKLGFIGSRISIKSTSTTIEKV